MMARSLVDWRMAFMKSKVSVFGLGYVGSVTAACLASQGHSVIGVDLSSSKVEQLQKGRSPIVEPRMADLVAECHAATACEPQGCQQPQF